VVTTRRCRSGTIILMPFFVHRVTKGSKSIERSEARLRRNLCAIVASRSVGSDHHESGSRSSDPGQIFPVHRRSGHHSELSMESPARSCPLTVAETWLESRAGIEPAHGPFLVRVLDAVVYPDLPEWPRRWRCSACLRGNPIGVSAALSSPDSGRSAGFESCG
jgi:hypothetical protein